MLSTFGILAALAFAALINVPWLPTAQQTKRDVSEVVVEVGAATHNAASPFNRKVGVTGLALLACLML